MNLQGIDIANLRHRNALALFDEFVHATVSHPDAATLRGLERRFAERVGIQPSYWSQIKSRARQIGERLARQFEQHCGKPAGWLDLLHDNTRPVGADPSGAGRAGPGATMAAALAGLGKRAAGAPGPASVTGAPVTPPATQAAEGPRDDDERFIIGLVLSYYRRNPQRARQRLLDLLGEVLVPPPVPTAPPPRAAAPALDETELWSRSQRGVAPLKNKR